MGFLAESFDEAFEFVSGERGMLVVALSTLPS